MQNVITFNFYRGVVELVSRLDNECDELILRVIDGYGSVIWHDDQRVTVASDDFHYMIAARYWTGEGTLKIEIHNSFATYNFEIEKTATTDGVYLNQSSEFGYKLSNKTETAESYDDLKNKPSINGVKLDGDKTSEQLGLLPEDADHVTHDELTASLNLKQNKLYAGRHISIDGDIISAHGFGNANFKELTKSEYDALPASKLRDNVIYFILPYEDYTDESIVVRSFEDGTVIWYFNNFPYWGSDDHYAVPARLERFLPTPPSSDTYSYMTSSYEIVDGQQSATQSGWIGFLMNYNGQNFTSVRSWTIPLTQTNNGHFNARLILGADKQGGTGYRQQITEYIAPEDDNYGKPYGRIILNGNTYTSDSGEREVSHGFNAPSGGGIDGELFIQLNSNNEKVAEYLYISNAWVQIDP